ncbi:hypothetical protein CSIV_14300 [Microbacterium sp. CSI-V]|uniref:gp53-like domain-containing protein n=1 Tax=Microbacterium sp. CSI-V TaxID=1933777 RepID=UPI00097C70E3|nr:hypothetical protein [Microbacterium sp. CSI-V]ONI62642.1 hypothetical protein CSIV_14300 [Microbacterium sp. CSI-V]
MALDSKKHATLAPGEAPSRAGLANSLLSVNDVVPVANATEQAQVVAALSTSEFPVGASRPLTTARADARPLHQIEVSRGGQFVPASGVLSFPTKTAADAWGSSFSSLLSGGDQCSIGSALYQWDGTAWRRPVEVDPSVPAGSFVFIQSGTNVASVDSSGAGMSITFYRPFPSTLLSTVVTDGDASGGGSIRGVASPSRTGFSVLWGGPAGLRRANWFAVGY